MKAVTQDRPALDPAWMARLARHEPAALSRAISWIENDDPRGVAVLQALTRQRGRAWVIGITGVPGAGKSTLLPQLARRFEAQDLRVAILAVDPSSPRTGGAILGDRIRGLGEAAGQAFFRSLGSRGRSGGLSGRVSDVVRFLDGAGFDIVLVETVGAGQSEVAIADVSHTVLVVVAPGLGDDIQAMKAGILEIGSVIGVNKCDRSDAADTATMIEQGLSLSQAAMKLKPGANTLADGSMAWHPPVQLFSGLHGTAVDDLLAWMQRHRGYLSDSGQLLALDERRDRARFEDRLRELLYRTGAQALQASGLLEELAACMRRHEIDPIEAAARAHHELARAIAPSPGDSPAGPS